MKYTIIKTLEQYYSYCNISEELTFKSPQPLSDEIEDEIELLTLLIEKYDEEHDIFPKKEVDPIRLLKSLMADHKMKAKQLAEYLLVSKGLVSDILNYKKGLSKDIIRKLAERFAMRQEAFNRPYKLISPLNSHLRNAGVMNTKKDLEKA
jgi:HTH-type transcriptional regulator/antitoxin HigA